MLGPRGQLSVVLDNFGCLFTGFTFANWPFSTLPQSLAGLAQVAVNVMVGVGTTLLFTPWRGQLGPDILGRNRGWRRLCSDSVHRAGRVLRLHPGLRQLGRYPFESVSAPLASAGQFFVGSFITLVGVVVLVYPNFDAQLAANAPILLPDALGWAYSSIVVAIVAALPWRNGPCAGIDNRTPARWLPWSSHWVAATC